MNHDEMIKILEQFVAEEYPDGIEMYADYRDEVSNEQAFKIVESNDPMGTFYDMLFDAYIDADSYYIHDVENEFDKWCEQHGYDCTADDLDMESIYINEYVDIYPDYDHYLDQEINCRLIVDNGDANYDFTHNPNQDNDFTIEDGAGIIWLGQQMGYSIEMMQDALDKGINMDLSPIDDTAKVHLDSFLESLVNEAANAWGIVALTFLVKMSLRDLIKFKEEHAPVTVELNGMNCGFFDEWNGGGSLFELDCPKKSVTIPYDKIFRLIPDINKYGYSVNEVYGLWGGAYADAEVAS